ncbi:MAG: glycoside hydrolase family 2 TIM barrel-domain containing protein, partial [Candidatus Glassbacteria bacterium]
ALEQLRELIGRDRNHPSVFAWGLCNEIGGQNPPAYRFAERLYQEASRLDPHRLRTYASNSLAENCEKDVSGVMDFIEWNEYYESWYPGTVQDMKENLERIHAAFPDKPIVISEYGYCQCRPDRTGGDPRLAEILRTHTEAYREYDYVAGAIFFCLNDYRTHIGDKGLGALKQRVHGVMDLYGERKPSFEVLRSETSPAESLAIRRKGGKFTVVLAARGSLPSYRLDGYSLRLVVYGFQNLPMESHRIALAGLDPGRKVEADLPFAESKPVRLKLDLLRPTGFSAATAWWTA